MNMIQAAVWFGVCWFALTFVQYYYYLYIKKEKIAQEIKANGPIFKSQD